MKLPLFCHKQHFFSTRYVEDLNIKCFCPAEETLNLAADGSTVPAQPGEPLRTNYHMDDVVCAVVLEIKKDSHRLLVGMKCDSLPDPREAERRCQEANLKLGLVPGGFNAMPASFRYTVQAVQKNVRK